MSPLTPEREDGLANEPCPHIQKTDSYSFCAIHDHRPTQCKTHEYPATFCPIGIQILGLEDDPDGIRDRVQRGDFVATQQHKGIIAP